MTIHGIDHVELYVGDARQAAHYLCTSFGFRICGQGGPETGLSDQRSLLLGQGDVRVLLTSGLSAEHPASQYVARHGDGVAVIGFGVTDAAGMYAHAVAAGATEVAPPVTHETDTGVTAAGTVSGFGDVSHRLVQRDGDTPGFLPGVVDLTTDPDGEDTLLALIDHAAICVPAGELDPTVGFYKDAFGFSEIYHEYIEVGEQGMESRVVQSPSGGVTFTLIQPDPSRKPGQIDDFLAWHGGSGVQHLAFRTHDIVTAVRTFASRGVAFALTPGSYYDLLEERLGAVDVPVADLRELGVLVDRDHWGQMFQIFTQSMHIRRTMFLEIIDRHGARTFGSSNITALYEAKERELTGAVYHTKPT
jgi:4-hydroxymandelate synthase